MTENGQIEAYSPPPDAASLTSEESAAALDVIMAEAASDKLHPYTNQHHIQHQVYKDGVRQLFEKKASADSRSPITKACDEALSGLAVKTAKLRTEGEAELAACKKLGIGLGDVPADLKNYDLKAYNVAVWKMQRLEEEGTPESLDELSRMMDKEVQSLPAEPELAEAVRHFNQARSILGQHVPDEIKAISESIIGIFYKANKAKYGGTNGK